MAFETCPIDEYQCQGDDDDDRAFDFINHVIDTHLSVLPPPVRQQAKDLAGQMHDVIDQLPVR